MIITEREAGKKWCLTMKRDIDGGIRHCVGSLCMAWRVVKEKPIPNPGDEDSTGYCGLAGNPRGVS